MNDALCGGVEQLVAVLRRHLDEIAEHVVVPDLQRLDAGRIGIARLQRGDHPARFVAQRARLVERAVVAGAHEAAVALEQGQLVGERRRERIGDGRIRTAQRGGRVCQLGRDLSGLLQRAGELRGRQNAVADGGKIARTAAVDHQPRQRAGEIGRGLEPRAHVAARRAGERSERPARRLYSARAGHSP